MRGIGHSGPRAALIYQYGTRRPTALAARNTEGADADAASRVVRLPGQEVDCHLATVPDADLERDEVLHVAFGGFGAHVGRVKNYLRALPWLEVGGPTKP